MKLHEILFWFLIFFLPTQLGKHFWPDFAYIYGLRVDYLAPTVSLTDLLLLGVLTAWGWEKTKKRNWLLGIRNWSKEHWYLLLILFYFSVTSLFAANPGVAFYKLAKIAELFFLGLYVAKNKKALGVIVKVLPIAVIFASLVALFQFLNQGSLGGLFWFLGERTFTPSTPGIALAQVNGALFLRPYGTFSHPNSLAGFLLVSLVLTAPFWFQKKKVFTILYSLFTIFIVLLSFSRSVWLAGVIFGLWFLIRDLWVKKTKGKTFLFISAFLLVVFLVLNVAYQFSSGQAVSERIQLSQTALVMIKTKPLTGVGLNNFIAQLPHFWQEQGVYLLQPVHNLFLLVAVETGLVGFLLFLWLLFSTLRRLFGCPSGLSVALAFFAILLTGLFDHYWLTLQQNMFLLAIVLGLAFGDKMEK